MKKFIAVNKEMDIKVGDVVYENILGNKVVKRIITRVTNTLLVIGNVQYRKDGSLKTDEYKRNRLYVATFVSE